MSTCWNFECKTCGGAAALDSPINHGDAFLRSVAAAYPHVRAAETACPELEIYICMNNDALIFLREHNSHEIWLVNEYGDREPMNIPPPTPT